MPPLNQENDWSYTNFIDLNQELEAWKYLDKLATLSLSKCATTYEEDV